MNEDNVSLFKTIFEQTPISTQIFTLDGEIYLVNKAWEKLWNIKFSQVKSYNIFKDKQLEEMGIMPHVKQAFKGEAVSLPMHKYILSKTVDTKGLFPFKWLQAEMYPIKNKFNEITHIVLQHEDISGKREAEEIMYKLAAIVESTDDVIVSKTLDGTITSWNKSAVKLFGYTAEEAIGKHITLIIPPELHKEEEVIISNIKQGRRVNHFETVRMTKDNRRINLSITVSPIKDNQGNIIGASKIARDITEQKRMEQQKDDFLSVVSHELKTPLTSVKAFTQLLERQLLNVKDLKTNYYIQRMDGQLDKLITLVNDLLDVSKIQAGKLQFNEESFNFDKLVVETIDEVQATTKNHTIIKDCKADQELFADKYRLSQVITNLLTNAIKYSPNADKIVVSTSADNERITLKVQDFGVGIPDNQKKQLFERFYRADSTAKKFSGLGLGLYISHQIVSRHGGEIKVSSKEGEGSIFAFTIPVSHK